MSTKWALKQTDNRAPIVGWALLALGTVLVAVVLDWRDREAQRGAIVGLVVGTAYATLLAQSLREVIDQQSEALAQFGQEGLPRAKAVPIRTQIRNLLIVSLLLLVLLAVMLLCLGGAQIW
jgi:hypothetical protein